MILAIVNNISTKVFSQGITAMLLVLILSMYTRTLSVLSF